MALELFNALRLCNGDIAMMLLALSPHGKELLGSFPSVGPLFVVGLHILLGSVWVLSGFSSFGPQSKNMHARANGETLNCL